MAISTEILAGSECWSACEKWKREASDAKLILVKQHQGKQPDDPKGPSQGRSPPLKICGAESNHSQPDKCHFSKEYFYDRLM